MRYKIPFLTNQELHSRYIFCVKTFGCWSPYSSYGSGVPQPITRLMTARFALNLCQLYNSLTILD